MVHSPEFYKLYRNTYLQYKELYGEKVCVFLLKGHFWEFYGTQDPYTQAYEDTVKEITDILGVKLTVYQNGAPDNKHGLFAGVPISTLDKWAGKLTALGWTVVVMEEIRNTKGEILKRDVTRVLSPGTHIDNAVSSETFFIGSLWFHQNENYSHSQTPSFGAAVADLTTGQVYLYNGETTGRQEFWYADNLRHFFQLYKPRELLVSWDGAETFLPSDDTIRSLLVSMKTPIYKKTINSTTTPTTKTNYARDAYMEKLFQPRTALPFRTWCGFTQSTDLSEKALYKLLEFSNDHAPDLASNLQQPIHWHPSTHLHIINNALHQLNYITDDSNQSNQSIVSLFTTPYTSMGKRALSQRLCTPLANSSSIRERLESVQWFLACSKEQSKQIDSCFQCMYDLPRLHRTIIRGTLQASDVLQLAQTYISCSHLLECVETSMKHESIQEIKNALEQCILSLDKYFDRVGAEKATSESENEQEYSFLQESIAPKSKKYETLCSSIHTDANNWLKSFTTTFNLTMELDYKSHDKTFFTVQITKTQAKLISAKFKDTTNTATNSYTIKTLTSNARLEHPALEKFQASLDSAHQSLKRALDDESRSACIGYIEETRSYWSLIEEWCTDLDCTNAIAKTSIERGFVCPTILDTSSQEESSVSCKGLRHPLIEAQKRASKLVVHDVNLDSSTASGWLLYGMNASGKSSLMKAIGISVILAQCGSFVPALEMTLKPFQTLATRIVNHDNVWAGLSSFAVEMSELREIFSIADHQTLVLGDELCSGTESVSATSIVASSIQWLQKTKTRFVLATHLHDLMKFPEISSSPTLSVLHLHVEYNRVLDKLIYHRDLKPGSGNTLYGLEVAKALHLPFDLLENAHSYRKKLLGETSHSDASQSAWNKDIVLKKCEVCGNSMKTELEVHHIEERHLSTNGRNRDGTGTHDIRNLIVVCDKCHNDHHSEAISIGSVIDTSNGPERSVTTLESLESFRYVPTQTQSPKQKQKQKEKEKQGQNEETIKQLKSIISKNPGLHWKLIKFQAEKVGIEITEKELKQLRTNNII
jgi:DNA mismatch repair protein MutS